MIIQLCCYIKRNKWKWNKWKNMSLSRQICQQIYTIMLIYCCIFLMVLKKKKKKIFLLCSLRLTLWIKHIHIYFVFDACMHHWTMYEVKYMCIIWEIEIKLMNINWSVAYINLVTFCIYRYILYCARPVAGGTQNRNFLFLPGAVTAALMNLHAE